MRGQRPRAFVSHPAFTLLWLAHNVLLRTIRIEASSIVTLPFRPVLSYHHARAPTLLLSNQSITPLDLQDLIEPFS
jgi:hypothetical protein